MPFKEEQLVGIIAGALIGYSLFNTNGAILGGIIGYIITSK